MKEEILRTEIQKLHLQRGDVLVLKLPVITEAAVKSATQALKAIGDRAEWKDVQFLVLPLDAELSVVEGIKAQ